MPEQIMPSRTGPSLRALIVEDEFVIALDLAAQLEEAGYEVCGPASSVEKALGLIRARLPDFALLDVNLGGENSYPIARALRQAHVPFCFLSGYSNQQLDGDFSSERVLEKPVMLPTILTAISRLLSPEVVPAGH